MVAQLYVPVVEGKWWSRSGEELAGIGEAKRRDFGHISRIMETELGEILGEQGCTSYQDSGQEC